MTDRPWWPWLKRGAGLVFFVFVVALLVSQARHIEWHQVRTSLANYPVTTVWGGILFAAASFTLFSCFDLLGRRYTGHTISTGTVMLTTFISYVFTLNLGAVVGSVATRYRLYSRLGLKTGTITRIMSLSMLTNWMGYLFVAGLIFSIKPPELPDHWPINATGLRIAGIALLTAAAVYLGLCAFMRQRTLNLRGHQVDLPSTPMAALQLLMGASNWLLMSGILFILLQYRVSFSAVASVLLLSAIAGVIAHIPASLGVLEAVFVALLSHQLPQADILAALVAYRVIYYLTPLGIATLAYLVIEGRAKLLASSAPLKRPRT